MQGKVVLLSGKSCDIKFMLNFMCNWFGANTRLSEIGEKELRKFYGLFLMGGENNEN